MRELVLATVVAEIKNAFVDEISDPELIELLYRGVAEPLGMTLSKVGKGTASKIVSQMIGGSATTANTDPVINAVPSIPTNSAAISAVVVLERFSSSIS